MSIFTSIAVVGSGGIGEHIIKALSKATNKVIVLSRPSSSPKGLPDGVKVIPIDFSDVAAVTKIFLDNAVQAVVSALGQSGIGNQDYLAEAAKAAGVQLFVPSEYGMPSDGYEGGLIGDKEVFARKLKSIGLPYARFYVGMFGSWMRGPLVGFGQNGKVNYIGSGKTEFSVTADEDIGGFIAHVLTTLPSTELQNKIFRLQGQRVNFLELAKILNTGAVKVDAIPGDEDWHGLLAFLQERVEVGALSTGYHPATQTDEVEAAGSSNHLWEGHKWIQIE